MTTVRFSTVGIGIILRRRGLESGGKVQRFIGQEVLRRNDKRVPFRNGPLRNTAYVTPDGKQVVYPQIYAEKQYKETPDTRSYDPNRGGHWHDRTMAAERKDIVAAAAKLAGGHT